MEKTKVSKLDLSNKLIILAKEKRLGFGGQGETPVFVESINIFENLVFLTNGQVFKITAEEVK